MNPTSTAGDVGDGDATKASVKRSVAEYPDSVPLAKKIHAIDELHTSVMQ